MIKLNLSVLEVSTILAGLMELPSKVSFDLIHKIKSEGDRQLAEQEALKNKQENEESQNVEAK